MTIVERFRRLSFWNKIAALGSIASIVGLALFILPFKDESQTTISQQAGSNSTQIGTVTGTVIVNPPTETQQISRTEESIKANQRLLTELSSEINNLNLVLDLSEKLKAEDFLDEAFLVRIRSLNLPTFRDIEILFEVAKSFREDRKYQWGFMFESFFIENRTKFVTNYGLLGAGPELGAIPFPLSLVNSARKPFKKIRDLDQCLIEVFAPSRFARYVSQIRLIANSGFEFTKHTHMYSRAVRNFDWEETDYALGDNFSSPWKRRNDQKYSWLRARKVDGDLQIDVTKSYLVENGNPMPEVLRLQY